VRGYGGLVVFGEVASAEPAAASADGDLRFAVGLADGRSVTARRVLVATGLRDVLPEVPGLAEHWGHSVVHCPYCHGWEVRDEAIGILATGPRLDPPRPPLSPADRRPRVLHPRHRPGRVHAHAVRRTRHPHRREPVLEVVRAGDGGIAGVRLADGRLVERRILAVATGMRACAEGLAGLNLPMLELPEGVGRQFVSGMAGVTGVPGVWVAGNATDLTAQVGASAAAGAHINADLATADTDAATTGVAAAT